ncbi:MAG: hypothetical protein UV05_C0030G0005 [candidate division CPR1 bacterium GW2011_GWA2_42_17]|uniref:Cell shape-determining protein MreC n=1 Tax=candidate division CPR1 bacterium GW2011_GWA2_42_17 TaxID=1618341 RepID=A0A0G0Z495_9BACT|nr:MAG: hypothetical protein UV05_C0030G0005 [candidate division CPR1 bacterium GW2011_GWA2_42_17]
MFQPIKKQITALASLIIVVIAILWWTAAVWQGPVNYWLMSALTGFFKWQGQAAQILQDGQNISVSIQEIALEQDKKIIDMEKKLLDLWNKVKKEKIGVTPAYLVAGRGADIYNVAIFEGDAPPLGAAVVSADGFLIGRVFSVSGSIVLVWPITGANFKLSARLVDQPNFNAVLQADMSGLLRLSQLPREVAIKENALVETSAFDNIIPEGLAVASVKGVFTDVAVAPEAALLPLFLSVWSQPVLMEWKR